MLFGWQGSLGNGGAMRVAPVGLFFYDSPDIYEHAKASSVITHAHPVGIDGAAVVAAAVAEAVRMNPADSFDAARFCEKLLEMARTEDFQNKLRAVRRLIDENVAPKQAADELDRSFRADESVPFAVYSFIRYPNSFQDCLLCAIGNGGDRDTLGAIASSISGAFLGAQGIPSIWKSKLENRDYLEKLGLLLLQTRQKSL